MSREKKIIDRIHNTRQKRSAPSDSTDPSPAKRGRPKINTVLSQYPPLRDFDGDDDVSTSRNIKALEKELEKENPRKDAVLPLMRQTFPTRRQNILSEAADTNCLLKEYPALSLPYVVSCDVHYATD